MNVWFAEIWRAWRASLRRPGFQLLAASVLSAQAAQADAPHSIRIAVPDLSAGSQPSAGGVVDVLRSQQLLEQ